MPFKIVQTRENNRTLLTIVPSKWEHNGILSWPTQRNEMKLIHNDESVPQSYWKSIQCIIKREYFTLDEAERELKIMKDLSDTDSDAAINYAGTKQRSRPLHNTRLLPPVDLNDQIVFHPNTEATGQVSPHDNCLLEENNNPMLITLRADEEQEIIPNAYQNTQTTNKFSSSSTTAEPNSEAYVNVTQDQIFAQLLHNQEKIISQIAVLQSSVDFLMGKTLKITRPDPPVNKLPIKPLNCKDDLDNLESKLKDEQFYNKVVTDLTFVCGQSGKCKGVDSCYKLVDYFFTREILTHCNWTGSTRILNGEKKIPFKFYSEIRNCFLDVVRKSDNDFTENDADKFFKMIIKNAKARLQNKHDSVTRTSKLRVKKQTLPGPDREQLNENNSANVSPPPQQISNREAPNNVSPPPQQISNEETPKYPLQDDNSVEYNLNDQQKESDK